MRTRLILVVVAAGFASAASAQPSAPKLTNLLYIPSAKLTKPLYMPSPKLANPAGPRMLNPQPLPPRWSGFNPGGRVTLNPQPLPPRVLR